MNLEQSFLKVLETQPKDQATRNAYADWLEDEDRPEEADRQRNWITAYEWMEARAAECGGQREEYDWDGTMEGVWEPITAQVMIQAGHNWLAARDYFVQRGTETARSVMGGRMEDYWKYWSIVTGINPPRQALLSEWNFEAERNQLANIFSCSC